MVADQLEDVDYGPVILVSFVDAAASAGVTYRRANYWVCKGYVRCCALYPASAPNAFDLAEPCSAAEAANPGSGYARLMHPDEALVLRNLARLSAAGLALEVAAPAARALAAGEPYAVLAGGVTVRVEPEVTGG